MEKRERGGEHRTQASLREAGIEMGRTWQQSYPHERGGAPWATSYCRQDAQGDVGSYRRVHAKGLQVNPAKAGRTNFY